MDYYRKVLDFYKDKRVLVTGNFGFKGSWMTYVLLSAGANVAGVSLEPPTEPALFDIIGLRDEGHLDQKWIDVRSLDDVKEVFETYKPEIVIHLATQPITLVPCTTVVNLASI